MNKMKYFQLLVTPPPSFLLVTSHSSCLQTYDNQEHSPSTTSSKTSEDSNDENNDADDDEDDGRGSEEFVQIVVRGVEFDDLEEFGCILRHQVFLEFDNGANDEQSKTQNLKYNYKGLI